MTSILDNIGLDLPPKFRNFDWEKAKTFYYVAKFGSFVSASRFLGLTQSALSRQVMYLEDHLEYPLFSRHSAGVKLTRKGEELLNIIETTFLSFKGFTRNLHTKSSNGKKQKIRIATTHALAAYVFNNLILDYSKEKPQLAFELIGEDHLIDIILNDVDIAIRPYDPKARGVIQEPLFTLEKKLFASPNYLEKYGEPKTVEDLKNHRLIGHAYPEQYPYSDVNWILKLGMTEGQLHKPIFASNSIECSIKAAKKGLGIVSSYEEMELIKKSNLQHILPDITSKKIEDYFIYPTYLKKDGEIVRLKKYLLEKLSSQKT